MSDAERAACLLPAGKAVVIFLLVVVQEKLLEVAPAIR